MIPHPTPFNAQCLCQMTYDGARLSGPTPRLLWEANAMKQRDQKSRGVPHGKRAGATQRDCTGKCCEDARRPSLENPASVGGEAGHRDNGSDWGAVPGACDLHMTAYKIIEDGSFGPNDLAVLRRVFDEVWADIAANFGNDPAAIEAASNGLANTIISLAKTYTRDPEHLKDAALRLMRREHNPRD
jgi:hypothetical protein